MSISAKGHRTHAYKEIPAKEFTKRKFAWLEQMKNERRMPSSRALFALALSGRFNRHKGGMAWPSYRYLAEATGLSTATILRLYHLSDQYGHLKVEWGKPGRGSYTNRCWMVTKAQPKTREKGQPADLSEARTKVHGRTFNKGSFKTHKGSSVDQIPLKPPLGGSKRERESPAPTAFFQDRTGPQNGAAGSAFAPSHDNITGRPTGPIVEGSSVNQSQTDVVEGSSVNGHDDVVTSGLAELEGMWKRGPWSDKKHKAANRTAYDNALRVTTHGVILAGARVWVSAEKFTSTDAGCGPQYLPKLFEWLNDRRWEEAPPPKAPPQKRTNNQHQQATINRADDPMCDSNHGYGDFDKWMEDVAELSEWRAQAAERRDQLAETEAETPKMVRYLVALAESAVQRYANIEQLLLKCQEGADWYDRPELYDDEGRLKRAHVAYKVNFMARSYNFAPGEDYTLPMIEAVYGEKVSPCALESAIRRIIKDKKKTRPPNSSGAMLAIIEEEKQRLDLDFDSVQFRQLLAELQAAIAKAKTPNQTSIVHSDQKDDNILMMDHETGLLLTPRQHEIVRAGQRCVDDVNKYYAYIMDATDLLTMDRFGFRMADRNVTDQQLRTIVDEAICAAAVFKSTEELDDDCVDPQSI